MSPRRRVLSDLFARIESAARGIALDLGRPIQFTHSGGESIALGPDWDACLEAALLHAVRNSLDHGSQGVSGKLSLTITASLDAAGVRIECRDSGSGIDATRVREAARERMPRFDAEMGAMSDDDVLQLLFLPGFSLSRGASLLSGRGYGLNIVREAVETKLEGQARIESRVGQGTRLVLRIPLRD